MDFRFKIRKFEAVTGPEIAGKLRALGYQVDWNGGDLRLLHRSKSGFLQNGFGIYMVDQARLIEDGENLRLRIDLSKFALGLFLTCSLLAIISQFFLNPSLEKSAELTIAAPFLIIAAIGILLFSEISTIRRDVIRACTDHGARVSP